MGARRRSDPDIQDILDRAATYARAVAWLASNDTGASSRFMLVALLSEKPVRKVANVNVPWDTGDFGRCSRMLEDLPELRARLPRLARVSETWRRLAAKWASLESLYKRYLVTHEGWAASRAFNKALRWCVYPKGAPQ